MTAVSGNPTMAAWANPREATSTSTSQAIASMPASATLCSLASMAGIVRRPQGPIKSAFDAMTVTKTESTSIIKGMKPVVYIETTVISYLPADLHAPGTAGVRA